jgi:hypothetical protein
VILEVPSGLLPNVNCCRFVCAQLEWCWIMIIEHVLQLFTVLKISSNAALITSVFLSRRGMFAYVIIDRRIKNTKIYYIRLLMT